MNALQKKALKQIEANLEALEIHMTAYAHHGGKSQPELLAMDKESLAEWQRNREMIDEAIEWVKALQKPS